MTASRHPVASIMMATGNAHKLMEVRALFAPLGVSLLGAPEGYDAVEDGVTFADNATIKVRALKKCLARQPSSPQKIHYLLADDSGLVVPALNQEPGVRSARYALGQPGFAHNADAANRNHLLANMAALTGDERRCYFICVLALLTPDGAVTLFEGRVEGHVAQSPRGKHGFGYDPLFMPTGFQKTFAEGGQALKEQLSHRAQAIKVLAQTLNAAHSLALF